MILDDRVYLIQYNNLLQQHSGVYDSATGKEIPASIVQSLREKYANTQTKLVESERLRAYETIYLTENSEGIKQIILQINQANRANLEKKTQLMSDDLFALRKRYPIVEFIYFKVFPYHFNRRKPVESTKGKEISNKIKPSRKPISDSERLIKILGDSYERIPLKDPYQKLLESSSLLEEMLKGAQPLFIIDGFCYRLFTIGAAHNTIKIGNRQYYLSFYKDIKEIEGRFLQLLNARIEKLVLEDKTLQKFEEKLREKGEFEDVVKRSNYRKEEIGFFIDKGKFYVSLHIPEFTLQDFSNNFYLFNPCTIAVELKVENDKVVAWEQPIVWENYSHPFLPGSNVAKQSICMSSTSNFEGVKSEIIRKCQMADKGETKIEHQIYIALRYAKDTLLGGYFHGVGPYHHLDTTSFREEHNRYLSTPQHKRKKPTDKVS